MALLEHGDGGPDRRDGRWDAVAVSTLPMGCSWRAAGLDEARVVELAAALGAAPPILVRSNDLLVVDGAHRVAAARRLGTTSLPVEWFAGSALDAAEAFVAANQGGGLAPTGDDRAALARWVLRAEPVWSDRRIAAVCGVAPKAVARCRGALPPAEGVERRIGRDGRSRPARGSEVRALVAAALEADPGASLRAIAARVGASPETVRSVRAGLRSRLAAPCPPPVAPSAASPRRGWLDPAPPPSWQADTAFGATDEGLAFVEWFERTGVGADGRGRAGEVPLSRVYEIADEARRRATVWAEFAQVLEARARRRSPA